MTGDIAKQGCFDKISSDRWKVGLLSLLLRFPYDPFDHIDLLGGGLKMICVGSPKVVRQVLDLSSTFLDRDRQLKHRSDIVLDNPKFVIIFYAEQRVRLMV